MFLPDNLDDILYQVSKPARYTGGEWNSMPKKWEKTPIRIALAYPDIYEIGMSNLALPILYDMLNREPDVAGLQGRAFHNQFGTGRRRVRSGRGLILVRCAHDHSSTCVDLRGRRS